MTPTCQFWRSSENTKYKVASWCCRYQGKETLTSHWVRTARSCYRIYAVCLQPQAWNNVCREYSVAAILWSHVLLLPMFNHFYFYISTSPSMRAMPNMAVFCSSLDFVLSRYIAQLSSSSSSSSWSPLCRVFTLIFRRQTMSLGNAVLQPFCCSYSWCICR